MVRHPARPGCVDSDASRASSRTGPGPYADGRRGRLVADRSSRPDGGTSARAPVRPPPRRAPGLCARSGRAGRPRRVLGGHPGRRPDHDLAATFDAGRHRPVARSNARRHVRRLRRRRRSAAGSTCRPVVAGRSRRSSSTSATAAGAASPTSGSCGPPAGYAHLVMDTRGQGCELGGRRHRRTPTAGRPGPSRVHDPGHPRPGDVLLPARLSPTPSVRSRRRAATPTSTPSRVAVTGGSQGGGIAIAVAGLVDGAGRRSMPDVPFLCDFPRAIDPRRTRTRTARSAATCKMHRDHVEQVLATLAYFDGVDARPARPGRRRCSRSALMDETCPPSTVYAAFNRVRRAEGDPGVPVQRPRGRRGLP